MNSMSSRLKKSSALLGLAMMASATSLVVQRQTEEPESTEGSNTVCMCGGSTNGFTETFIARNGG